MAWHAIRDHVERSYLIVREVRADHSHIPACFHVRFSDANHIVPDSSPYGLLRAIHRLVRSFLHYYSDRKGLMHFSE